MKYLSEKAKSPELAEDVTSNLELHVTFGKSSGAGLYPIRIEEGNDVIDGIFDMDDLFKMRNAQSAFMKALKSFIELTNKRSRADLAYESASSKELTEGWRSDLVKALNDLYNVVEETGSLAGNSKVLGQVFGEALIGSLIRFTSYGSQDQARTQTFLTYFFKGLQEKARESGIHI